jgi:hypothetical protein
VLEHLLDGSRAVVLVTHRLSAHAVNRAAPALRIEDGLVHTW